MGQSGGPGLDGPIHSPRGQQVEELMCRMMPVTQDVVYLCQTEGGGDGADLWLCLLFHNPLGDPLLSFGAAGKPHQASVDH